MKSNLRTSPGPGCNHQGFLVLCRARGAQDLVALLGMLSPAEPQPRQSPSCPCPSEGTDSGVSCPEQRSPDPEHLLGTRLAEGKGLAKYCQDLHPPSSAQSPEQSFAAKCSCEIPERCTPSSLTAQARG